MILIKYTKKAIDDLDLILETIKADKPSVAMEYVKKLQDYIQLLVTNPEMGIECKIKLLDRDCRLLFYGSYTIEYKFTKYGISIVKIKNTKQKRK